MLSLKLEKMLCHTKPSLCLLLKPVTKMISVPFCDNSLMLAQWQAPTSAFRLPKTETSLLRQRHCRVFLEGNSWWIYEMCDSKVFKAIGAKKETLGSWQFSLWVRIAPSFSPEQWEHRYPGHRPGGAGGCLPSEGRQREWEREFSFTGQRLTPSGTWQPIYKFSLRWTSSHSCLFLFWSSFSLFDMYGNNVKLTCLI